MNSRRDPSNRVQLQHLDSVIGVGAKGAWSRALLATAVVVGVLGCGGAAERKAHSSLQSFERQRLPRPAAGDDASTLDGTLAGYLAHAVEHSPQALAAFERWRAEVYRISRARRLPEPNLSVGYFVRSVETRVGPQRFRVGLSQVLPWPSKLSSAAEAASEKSSAAERALEAELLLIQRDVEAAYWSLWLVDEVHRLKRDHDAVLEGLASAVRGRLTTGAATLADLTQIDLDIARHHDHRGSHIQSRRKASAMLLAAIGAVGDGRTLDATDSPQPGVPTIAIATLRDRARRHPRLLRHDHLALGEENRAQAERADRLPRLRLGVDFIETGDAAVAGVPDSGKDPLIVSAALSIPLWAGNYRDAEQSAHAAAAAHRADREAAARRAEAACEAFSSDLSDAQRRIDLYENTLVPQAEATFQAVLGGYQAGRSAIAAVILAQRDLLELQIEHARARADHARAWAALEYIAGTKLAVARDLP